MSTGDGGSIALATAYRIQAASVVLVLVGCVVAVIMAGANAAIALLAVILTLASAFLGRSVAGRPMVFFEPWMIWAVGTFILIIGMEAGESSPISWSGGSAVALGSFAIVASWALHRFPAYSPMPESSILERFLQSALVGTMMGVLVALLATAIFVVGAFSDEPIFTFGNWIILVLAYIVAGVLGGVVVGALRPLTVWPLGLMVVGIPVAALIYAAIGIALVVMGDSKGPSTLREAVGLAGCIGVLAGPMGSLALHAHVGKG